MLFAVLVSSVLLSIGVSIFNLTLKELVLSSSGRESQFAFYAADTGIECAIYWDFKSVNPGIMFATSTASVATWRNDLIDAHSPAPTCIGFPLATSFKTGIIAQTPTSATTRFQLTIPTVDPQGLPASYCAIVDVAKSDALISTVIESRGYNTACDSSDPNRIERGLKVSY